MAADGAAEDAKMLAYVFLIGVGGIIALWLYLKGISMSLGGVVTKTTVDHVEEQGSGRRAAGMALALFAGAVVVSATGTLGLAPPSLVAALLVLYAIVRWCMEWAPWRKPLALLSGALKAKVAAGPSITAALPLGATEYWEPVPTKR